MESADDIETMFDDISYSKGATVLRMLRSFLAREVSPQPLMRRSLQQVGSSFLVVSHVEALTSF